MTAYLLTTNLSVESLDAWGWRIPFIFGIIIGPVGWIIRTHLDESPEFKEYVKNKPTAAKVGVWESLVDLFKNHTKAILSSMAVCIVGILALPVIKDRALPYAVSAS